MGWYQCSCGFITEETAMAGSSVVSVHHLHRSARVDGSGAIARMEEIPDPPPERERDLKLLGKHWSGSDFPS